MEENDAVATSLEITQRRMYAKEMLIGIGVYSLLLVVVLPLIDALGSNPARYAVAITPMIGFGLGVAAVYRAIQRADEFQRDLLLRTLAISFGLTATVTFGYGFLELVGAPQLPMFAVWPLMGTLWFVVGQVLQRQTQREHE